MKLGLVGLDTSHAVIFTEMLNDTAHQWHVPGAEVVACYPGGSQQFSLSRNRVHDYTEQLTDKFGLKVYNNLADLAHNVDAILLESVDGRQHLEQFNALAVGKPVFIDKPFATSTADAAAIVVTAESTHTPIMSASSLRFASGIAGIVPEGEKVLTCEAFGPCAILEDYPGMFWYGIHSADILFSIMGTGCTQVRCLTHKEADVVLGEWADGRCAVMRGTRVEKGYFFGCTVQTATSVKLGLDIGKPPSYHLMVKEIVRFFETGVSPIDIRQTLQTVSFLEAADQSKVLGGAPVALAPL